MTDIILKQGTGVPLDTDLEVAEVAIDSSTGAMYTKLADGSVEHLNPKTAGGGGGDVDWNNINNVPDFDLVYAPIDHTHEIADVDGLQDALDAAGESLWTQSGDDIYYSDGNVGIGTDNPWGGMLHVNGVVFCGGRGDSTGLGFVDWKIYNGDVADGQSFHIASQTSGDFFTIDSSGNVGIGDAPSCSLDVKGANNGLCFRIDGASGASDRALLFSNSLNSLTWDINAEGMGTNGTLTLSTNSQPRLTINALGNVGIGTDSPQRKLTVSDTSGNQVLIKRTSSSSFPIINFESDAGLSYVGGSDSFATGASAGDFGMRSAGKFTFSTGGSGTEALTIDSSGNVGIGTDSPSKPLVISKGGAEGLEVGPGEETNDVRVLAYNRSTSAYNQLSLNGSSFRFGDPTQLGHFMTINSSGNVGIGMSPLRQASEAKEQLEDWKSAIEERMKAEPKADRSAVTQEITGFDKLPTLEETKERLERAAGDKLQVSGNISASGLIRAENTGSANKIAIYDGTNYTGLQQVGTTFNIRPQGSATIGMSMDGTTGDATFSGAVNAERLVTKSASTSGAGLLGVAGNDGAQSLVPTDLNGNAVDASVNLGRTSPNNLRFKDGFFSGTVNASGLKATYVERSGVAGLSFTATGGGQPYVSPLDGNTTGSNGVLNLGDQSKKFKDAHFSGTVDAAGFTVNGSPIGGGGLPDGDFTHNGKITATDFIATSDERVKDNITTAPVGLIDSLKGREWDWSESGEKGSGVVAQELEQVLPHLVHTDDEGMKSVAYNGLVAYLIEEVKALKAEVEALKS